MFETLQSAPGRYPVYTNVVNFYTLGVIYTIVIDFYTFVETYTFEGPTVLIIKAIC